MLYLIYQCTFHEVDWFILCNPVAMIHARKGFYPGPLLVFSISIACMDTFDVTCHVGKLKNSHAFVLKLLSCISEINKGLTISRFTIVIFARKIHCSHFRFTLSFHSKYYLPLHSVTYTKL